MGFSLKILHDEVGPEIEPLSPGNIIVFANGHLIGTTVPCAGRIEITTKNPLNNNVGTGNTGRLWGARLKHADLLFKIPYIILAKRTPALWKESRILIIFRHN